MVFMAIEPNLNSFDSFKFIIGHLRFKVRCWYNLIRPAKCHKLKVYLLSNCKVLQNAAIWLYMLCTTFVFKKSDLQTWSWTWTCVLPCRWWLWPNGARSHQRDAVLSGIPLDVPQQQRVRVGDHGSPWQPVALSLCRAGHRGQGLPGQLPPPLQRHQDWQEWDRWEGREWRSNANTGRCIEPGHGSVLTCWGWKWNWFVKQWMDTGGNVVWNCRKTPPIFDSWSVSFFTFVSTHSDSSKGAWSHDFCNLEVFLFFFFVVCALFFHILSANRPCSQTHGWTCAISRALRNQSSCLHN